MELSSQHYLLGLFAVANNIPAIPLYLSLCRGLTKKEQNRLCFVATLTAFITMMVAMLTGSAVLGFFDISLGAFRIAGGILLLITGINMVNSKTEVIKESSKKVYSEVISVAIIPVAIPLTTGAGTISTIIVFSENLHSWTLMVKLLVAIVMMAVIIYFIFRYSALILRILGHNGMDVLIKIFGLITLAIGVQFILTGLGNAYPNLLN